MSWTRVAVPAVVGVVAALLFGLIRPGLTDTYINGLSVGPLDLYWASLGGVLGALGALLTTRDYAPGSVSAIRKASVKAVVGAIAVGGVMLLVWRQVADGWKWIPALLVLASAIVLLGTVPRLLWHGLLYAAPKARPIVLRAFAAIVFAVIAWRCLVDPDEVDRLASTMFAVVLAVGLIAFLWIFMNVLVENARDNWAIFSAVSAAIVAAIGFAIMRGNISLKSLVVEEDLAIFGAGSGFWGHVEWPIFGAVLWGVGVYAMRQFSSRLIRVLIGIALGVITGWQIGDNSLLWQRPAITWSSALLWTAAFAIAGALWRARRTGAAPTPIDYQSAAWWRPWKLALSAAAVLVTLAALFGRWFSDGFMGSLLSWGSNISAGLWTILMVVFLGLYLLVPVFVLDRRLVLQSISGLSKPGALVHALPGALTGAVVGFTIATWLRSDFIGTGTDVLLAAAVPLALLGARIAWNNSPSPAAIAAFENRSHAVIFLGPALLFLSSALVIPAIRTAILSTLDRDFNRRDFTGEQFAGFNAEGDAFIGYDNYRELLNDVDTFDFSNWSNLWGSDLFWISLVLLAIGVLAGLVSGTRQNEELSFVGTGSSIGSMAVGGLVLAFAILAVLRGTFFNNLWWVITVTSLAVVFGLTIAVLSERAGRLESIAKSLIFMPMAISFVGASIVWRLQYQPRDVSKTQTGVLNAAWVQLGKLSHSGWGRGVVLVLLVLLLGYIIAKGVQRATAGEPFGGYVALLVVVGHLAHELSRRSLGGFQFSRSDASERSGGILDGAGWIGPLFVAVLVIAAIGAIGMRRLVPLRSLPVVSSAVALGGFLLYQLVRGQLGDLFGSGGEIVPDTIVFLQQARPFNNVFLMVILIWIQTGFAMVILSAAIRAVPTELIEAAEVDGATESQSFFRVVLPQILPTIGVVTTTLIVLVSKVFDIVKVATGGNFGTNVLANDMFEVSFSFANFTLGSAIAMFILLSVLPVMYLNIRRMQEART